MGGSFLYADTNAALTVTDDSGTTVAQAQDAINGYILEIYKFRGNKILDELETSIPKIAPTSAAQIDAYSSIQETLARKKESIMNDETMRKNSKIILTKYLDYMIDGIEKRKLLLQ